MVKSKLVWNMESFAFAFIRKWAKDTLVFPHEMHRVKVPAGHLLCAGTGAGPGEFVDASAKLKRKKKRTSDLLGPNPWNDPNNSNFQERNNEEEDRTRSRALCREDVCMYSVQVEGKKPVLAMDVSSSVDPIQKHIPFHPKSTSILCAITHILALAFTDDAFEAPTLKNMGQMGSLKVEGPAQCLQTRWDKKMLKRPVFRQDVKIEG
ncbi:hypothetical protein MMC22_010955 [Lobaria immixta]|nr:hypothetical protein [Lobaria immixta]